MRFTLPWSCAASSNDRHGGSGFGHKARYRHARDETWVEVGNQYDGEPITCPVQVRIDVFPPENPSAFDLDVAHDTINLPKAICDGLEVENGRGLLKDDMQIVAFSLYRRPAEGRGGLIVQVRELPDWEGELPR